MNWISEIKAEINSILVTPKTLRNFGLLIGGIFILISAWILWSGSSIIGYLLLAVGGLLFLPGLFLPNSLKKPYIVWMGAATIMGWFVSRIILTILFFLVISPLGLIARLFKKQFLDTKFNQKKESYWIDKPESREIDYSKMF